MNVPTGGDRVRYAGLVVAIIGFVVTRFLVAESLRVEAPLPFLVGGLLPLVVGLGLTVFGVALAVGAFSPEYVATVSKWCVVGTGAMVLVLSVTALEGVLMGKMFQPFRNSTTLVANVLLGGAVGGVLIGDRSAVNNRQRGEIRRQANRGIVLTRLLRHEVLNAATIVDGYAPLLDGTETDEDAIEAIQEAAKRIETTIEDVGEITDDPNTNVRTEQDLREILDEQLAKTRNTHPSAEIEIDAPTGTIHVRADDRLGLAVREFLRYAVENGEKPTVHIDCTKTNREVHLGVTNDGDPLPASERDLLERGAIPEYDDPSTGFSLQIVWLLIDRYGGRIETTDGASNLGGTTLTMVLPRTEPDEPLETRVGVGFADLYRVTVAGVIAGIVMGLLLQELTGLLPVIGSLYGVGSPVVGWLTHIFHSVVFALLFAAGIEWPPIEEYADDTLGTGSLGAIWGVVLGVGAAGIIMPIWLRLVGLMSTLPNVSLVGLIGHVVWGAVLGVVYSTLRDHEVGGAAWMARTLRLGDGRKSR